MITLSIYDVLSISEYVANTVELASMLVIFNILIEDYIPQSIQIEDYVKIVSIRID